MHSCFSTGSDRHAGGARAGYPIRSVNAAETLGGEVGGMVFVIAYVGPGAGLSAIGAFLAMLAGVFVAIVGFIWYPIKRLIRSVKRGASGERAGAE